ncbi:hypothetical protein TNCV_2608701 [Trichonephila clavipes]|uniref:Uncharacterized protein n=1 Tax=Trichonephila clavipes TaxID=2585209 RepID=A0A8X6V230_TRICX|nr:hypothetical protein TNCV_2608701 [Trichonephila clavipes]
MQAKGGNRLVPGPDYMVDALKLPNQAPRVSASNVLVVDSRYLNLVFGHTETAVTDLYGTLSLILLGVFGDCKFVYISNQF